MMNGPESHPNPVQESSFPFSFMFMVLKAFYYLQN